MAQANLQRLLVEKAQLHEEVEAIHGNIITGPKFEVDWFRGFDAVINALDNVDARRHVNRLCLSSGVPLIDSGSTGYRGQVRPILKGVTHQVRFRWRPG